MSIKVFLAVMMARAYPTFPQERVWQLLDLPNPVYTFADLEQQLTADMMLVGQWKVKVVENDDGVPCEVWRVCPITPLEELGIKLIGTTESAVGV